MVLGEGQSTMVHLAVRLGLGAAFAGGAIFAVQYAENRDQQHLNYVLSSSQEWLSRYRSTVSLIQDRKLAFAKKMGNLFGVDTSHYSK
jgi:hypothetical protein